MSQQEATDAFHAALLGDDPAVLYDRAPCGYLSTTPDGQIVKANATFLTWTGYALDELLGRSFADLLTPGGRIYHETHYAPMLRLQGSVREIAVDLRRRSGDRLPVLVNATLEREVDGTPRVVRIALFDATERRAYERELLRAKDRAEESEARARALARTLQQTLIPPSPPTIPALDLATAYRPAGDGSVVGGDFYDVFPVGQDEWVVAIGDVCGKGPEAAVVTALVRYTVRALAIEHPAPAEVLRVLNDIVAGHDAGRFCTMVLVRLRRCGDRWDLTVSTGGHPAPVVLDAGTGPSLVELTGPLVGAFPDQAYTDHAMELVPGRTLLLYTDGVTEARRGSSYYGQERLLAAAADLPRLARPLVDGILEQVLDFQDGVARDDIALVAMTAPAAAD